jgi:CheY-like chemotaxis protein
MGTVFMSSRIILSVGEDLMLLETRNILLRAAGYIVESARSLKQAIDHCLAREFDVVVMCHSVSSKDRDCLTCWIRASGAPTAVVSVPGNCGQSDFFADANLGHEPEKFLSGIKDVLTKGVRMSPRTAAPEDRRRAQGNKWRKTILCIDDDPIMLALRRHLLQESGYVVLTANGGPKGLKLFSTRMVDTVVLDYSMPMMNGGVVAAQMRQIKGDVPLILVSGGSTIPEEDLALFNRSITKAEPPSVLLSAIKEILCAPVEEKVAAGSAKSRRTYRSSQPAM